MPADPDEAGRARRHAQPTCRLPRHRGPGAMRRRLAILAADEVAVDASGDKRAHPPIWPAVGLLVIWENLSLTRGGARCRGRARSGDSIGRQRRRPGTRIGGRGSVPRRGHYIVGAAVHGRARHRQDGAVGTGAALARVRGIRVLAARPSGTEAELSFATLFDLLEGIDIGAVDGLPVPQRQALEAALLRAELTGGPPERFASLPGS
jgi:hypothetical protein